MVRIEWLGHACFLLEGDNHRIIIDPFQKRGVRYPEITASADIVLVTHDHSDHNNVKAVRGNPTTIRQAGHWESPISIDAIEAFHDKSHGSERGTTMVYSIVIEGIRITHLGDLGEIPSQGFIDRLSGTEVLLIPVGGVYTIDHRDAWKVVNLFGPNVVIPMHYGNEMVDWPLGGVEKFFVGKDRVKIFEETSVEVKKEDLPQLVEIWVLSPPRG